MTFLDLLRDLAKTVFDPPLAISRFVQANLIVSGDFFDSHSQFDHETNKIVDLRTHDQEVLLYV